MIATVLLSLYAMSQSVVRSLDISVTLKGDGGAHVHEVWNIDIGDDVKTEWYVAHYNMGERAIANLEVTDNGKRLVTLPGEWDVDADHEDKIGKCGIKPQGGGYEICWGVSSWDNHIYTTDYDIQGLVLHFPDNDGFGHWFADLNKDVKIRKFRLSVAAPVPLTADNCRLWGFGYDGDTKIRNGIATAQSDGNISKIGLLMSFKKGLFTPVAKGNGTFAELKDKAFEGSDFGGGSEEEPLPIWFWITLASILGGLLITMLAYWLRLRRMRRESRNLPYFKEVSPSWSLLGAAAVLTDYQWFNDRNLIPAMILRLMSQRKLEVVNDDETDKEGNAKKVLRIVPENVEMPTAAEYSDDYICGFLLYIMSQIADDDRRVRPERLEEWATKHTETLADFHKATHPDKDKVAMTDKDNRRLFGLRNFLDDFGKTTDKGIGDIRVWDGLLVYAQLFGFAKRLGDDLRNAFPKYFEQSPFANDVLRINRHNPMLLLMWSNSIANSQAASLHASGGTSFGGGGGFSGGGGGGGR